MKRRLDILASKLSVVVLTITVLLWAVSYPAVHHISGQKTERAWSNVIWWSSHHNRFYVAGVDQGKLKFEIFDQSVYHRPPSQKAQTDWLVHVGPVLWTVREHLQTNPAQWGAVFNIQCWVVCVLAGILPGRPYARRYVDHRRDLRRRRLFELHLCPDCGYDLCAKPHRCPECGAEAKGQPIEGAAA